MAKVPPVIGVSMPPGQMQLARTPRAALGRDEPGERVDATLARGVTGAEPVTADRGGRRDGDDRATAVGQERQAVADHREGAAQVDREHAEEVVDADLLDRREVGAVEDPGRGDDAGDPSERARGRRDGRADRFVVGDVDGERERAPPARSIASAVSRALPLVQVDDGNRGAPFRRELRRSRARCRSRRR